MTDLYISYSMRERHWVSKLVNALESEGYSVWWEHVAVLGDTSDDIRPDSQTALASAKCALAIWSPLAVDDDWVLQDAKQAQQSNKLFSVLYKDTKLPSSLNNSDVANLKQWRDGDDTHPEYQQFLRLLKASVMPSQPSRSNRKRAMIERKKRMQAQQSRHTVLTKPSSEKLEQLRSTQ